VQLANSALVEQNDSWRCLFDLGFFRFRLLLPPDMVVMIPEIKTEKK
jgi:hypothetical protein